MMNKAKRAIVTAAIIATLGASVFAAVSTTYAATTSPINAKPMSNLVTAIATKFNLNEDEVQAVFDEQRDQLQVNQETNLAKHLNKRINRSKLSRSGLHIKRQLPGKGPMNPHLVDDAK